ncbi:3-methyladenine DNA glycosylase AlkD [Prauserella shujinwangii]|uniref:3-methyladenine DNA glycosylase AlkD n=1 Tax=Prauserella shujinwangii TaxID=1453103 RepID=A0A2T0LSZ7_9PSEU|nr:DNA alkylation repair protein [Prauserella shujinwangii]PRX46774.1 3-methyladenine DNA glycosylase AlkD [Prauserella shujinwangii]
MSHPLVSAVRVGLADLADPARAEDMRRYMKSELPFRGVPKPPRARLARALFREFPLSDVEEWEDVVRQLWYGASYREERYLALDLTGHRAYLPWQTARRVPLYEELIRTGAWWDYVDDVAVHRIGPIHRAEPSVLEPVLRTWATDGDRWIRRTSVLCQVGAKERTDTGLLTHCVEANVADGDFFLRKAIGWALRDFARTDPGWVRRFTDDHPGLSPLSRREALRHLGAPTAPTAPGGPDERSARP